MSASFLQELTPVITLACSRLWQRRLGLDSAAAQTIEAFVQTVVDRFPEPLQLQIFKDLLSRESVQEFLGILLELAEQDLNATEGTEAVRKWMLSRLPAAG